MRKLIIIKFMIGIVWFFGNSILSYAENSEREYFNCEEVISNRFQAYKEYIEEKSLSENSLLKYEAYPMQKTIPKEIVECKIKVNDVCAFVDTDIRCVMAPCPSATAENYSSSREACANLAVYGIATKPCDKEVE